MMDVTTAINGGAVSTVGNQSYEINSLPALKGHDLDRLPFSLKILLENLLRCEDGVSVTREDIEALLKKYSWRRRSSSIETMRARLNAESVSTFTCQPV